MKFRVLPRVLAGALCLCAAVALARKPPPAAPPSSPPRPASLEQAVKQVQHQTSGHILAADTIQHGQGKVYRVKVLTPQGQVRVMQLRSKPRSQSRQDRPDSDQGGH
ncbi:MAG: PepSY domain-containing protein [Rhodanobacteraceae bacterium]